MYTASFDPPDRAPLDFNTDPTPNAVADAPKRSDAGFAHVPASDAQALLEQIGVPAHRARQVLAESLALDF